MATAFLLSVFFTRSTTAIGKFQKCRYQPKWHFQSFETLRPEVLRSNVANASYYSRRLCLCVLDRSTRRAIDSAVLRGRWNPWSDATRHHGHTAVCVLSWSVRLDPSRLVQRARHEHCRDDRSSLSIGLGILLPGRGGTCLKAHPQFFQKLTFYRLVGCIHVDCHLLRDCRSYRSWCQATPAVLLAQEDEMHPQRRVYWWHPRRASWRQQGAYSFGQCQRRRPQHRHQSTRVAQGLPCKYLLLRSTALNERIH